MQHTVTASDASNDFELQRPPGMKEASAPSRGLLRVEEAALWLGLGRTKTYELVARGELASVSIGRSRRVPVSALHSFVERLTAEGAI